jgi:hypothetical protein
VQPGTRTLLAAAAVAVAAFLLYHATLLPGQDLGDTASFQATVGESVITPRQAYPLYYATGALFVAALPGNVARAVNMASAVFGALACGLLAATVAAVTRRAIAGIVAGLLLAVSYTFWSQAVIAEAYALHACMMGLGFVALLAWAQRPTLSRMAVFFAIYALGFGNHLMMILLLPGFALFLLLAAPDGPASMLRPRVALLAAGMATLGAFQYLWNLDFLLSPPERAPGLVDPLLTFWFDVTKSDWRATMVAGVQEGVFRDRLAMYWFDLRQQFGAPGVVLAVAGMVWALWPGRLPKPFDRVARPHLGLALLAGFLSCWVFAFTYNVGDTHVFYIPSHVFVALFAGLGAGAMLALAADPDRWPATIVRRAPDMVQWAPLLQTLVLVALLAYPAWRAYDTFPAMDRSDDRQATQFYDRLTTGLTGLNAVISNDLNWQVHNGLDYYVKHTRPDLGAIDTIDALQYFPFLVASNRHAGRVVALTNGSVPMVEAAYGRLFGIERDPRVQAPPLSARLARLGPGTPYVFTLLEPYPDLPIDEADLVGVVRRLTGGSVTLTARARYNVMAGRVGERPAIVRSEDRPFRLAGRVGALPLDVRMECWLPADTIRRMWFGHVIVSRHHALAIDRGASLVAFDDAGRVKAVEYGWAIFAPQPRWIIPVKAGRR